MNSANTMYENHFYDTDTTETHHEIRKVIYDFYKKYNYSLFSITFEQRRPAITIIVSHYPKGKGHLIGRRVYKKLWKQLFDISVANGIEVFSVTEDIYIQE